MPRTARFSFYISCTNTGVIMRTYLWNIIIAVDQLGNTFLGGDPDETISSRAAKNQHLLVWRLLGSIMDLIDPGHMTRSLEADEGKDAIHSRKSSQWISAHNVRALGRPKGE